MMLPTSCRARKEKEREKNKKRINFLQGLKKTQIAWIASRQWTDNRPGAIIYKKWASLCLCLCVYAWFVERSKWRGMKKVFLLFARCHDNVSGNPSFRLTTPLLILNFYCVFLLYLLYIIYWHFFLLWKSKTVFVHACSSYRSFAQIFTRQCDTYPKSFDNLVGQDMITLGCISSLIETCHYQNRTSMYMWLAYQLLF